jgi:Peptidase_C39 like family
MVGIAAVAAVLVGTGSAHAVVTPPPGITTRTAQVTQITRITSASLATRATAVLPAAMPRSYRLKLHEQYQWTNYYCVPASTSMSLSTFGLKVSQDALAKKMRTTTRGTGGDAAATVIDDYLHPRKFDDRVVGDVVDHPELLMQRVSYDVGALRRAPVIQVWMERLPWNKDRLKGQWIGHAIVAYGYDQQAGTITVFDPWRPTGGTHTLPAKSLARTLQAGGGMHYISRL